MYHEHQNDEHNIIQHAQKAYSMVSIKTDNAKVSQQRLNCGTK